MFLPKSPALFASSKELETAEDGLNIEALIKLGLETVVGERYSFTGGRVVLKRSLDRAKA
jgi:hypothetical protein